MDDVPLGHIDYADFIELVVRQDVRPERPEDDGGHSFPDQIWELAKSCWVKAPAGRPSADAVFDLLSHFIDAEAGTPSHPSISDLEFANRKQGIVDQVESPREEMTEGRKETLGAEHPDIWDSFHDLALTCLKEGKLEKAEGLQEQVVEVGKRF